MSAATICTACHGRLGEPRLMLDSGLACHDCSVRHLAEQHAPINGTHAVADRFVRAAMAGEDEAEVLAEVVRTVRRLGDGHESIPHLTRTALTMEGVPVDLLDDVLAEHATTRAVSA